MRVDNISASVREARERFTNLVVQRGGRLPQLENAEVVILVLLD